MVCIYFWLLIRKCKIASPHVYAAMFAVLRTRFLKVLIWRRLEKCGTLNAQYSFDENIDPYNTNGLKEGCSIMKGIDLIERNRLAYQRSCRRSEAYAFILGSLRIGVLGLALAFCYMYRAELSRVVYDVLSSQRHSVRSAQARR